jgi:hypothetical protein
MYDAHVSPERATRRTPSGSSTLACATVQNGIQPVDACESEGEVLFIVPNTQSQMGLDTPKR